MENKREAHIENNREVDERREVLTKNLYVVYDVLSDDFSPVFEAANDDVAARAVQFMGIPAARLIEFVLFHVGSICGGIVEGTIVPREIAVESKDGIILVDKLERKGEKK